jgi:hypothetical protein
MKGSSVRYSASRLLKNAQQLRWLPRIAPASRMGRLPSGKASPPRSIASFLAFETEVGARLAGINDPS